MKINLSITFLPIIFFFSCSKDNSIEDLKELINQTKLEIQVLVNNSSGTSTQDCRTKFISGGDDCGPIITYGIIGIDTLELAAKFKKLSSLKSELWEKQDEKTVCDIIFPIKDSLISGKCLSCYEINELELECF